MPKFVRVRDKETRHEYTTALVIPEVHEVLKDEDALNASGKPRPQVVATQHVENYDALTLPELKAEIGRRNGGRDADAHIPTSGNKADLVAALQADDDSEVSR